MSAEPSGKTLYLFPSGVDLTCARAMSHLRARLTVSPPQQQHQQGIPALSAGH